MFQELQFPLVSSRVCRSSDDLVLFSDLIEVHLQLHHLQYISVITDGTKQSDLFTPVLQIFHQALLDNIKFRILDLVGPAISLQFLRRICEALAIV